MNIPLKFPCSTCGISNTVKVRLDATSSDWRCPSCNSMNYGFFSTSVTVGWLLLAKSAYELTEERDYSMSIVLSAVAMDCELSHLFCKWKTIESGLQCSQETLDHELRLWNVKEKIEGVCKLLDPRGIDEFVRSNDELRRHFEKGFFGFSIGSLSKHFQEDLFWPRNKILHYSTRQSDQAEAERCYKIGYVGLRILTLLDEKKRLNFEKGEGT